MIKTTPRGGAAAWLVAVSSAGFGLAAAASLTAVLPIRYPHGEGAAGFPAYYYYREGVELAGFLLVALLVPIAIVVGLQVWARLADNLSDRFPCLSFGETAAQAAAPFVGLLAVVPSLPLVASERSLDLGSAAAVALMLFGGGWLFVTRRPASGIAVAIAVGGAAGAAVSSLLTRPSPFSAWTAALIGALLAAWAARRRVEAGVWLLPIALVPLICGMGLSLMDGGVVVGRQGLGTWTMLGLVGALLAMAVAIRNRSAPPRLQGRIAAVVGTVVLAGICLNPAVDRVDLDAFHEGEWLAAAQAAMNGGMPFRDMELMHGFGYDLLRPLLAFDLFGIDAKAVRLLDASLASMAVFAAFAVAARCLGPGALAVSMLLVVAFGPGLMDLGPRTVMAWAAMVPFLLVLDRPRRSTAAFAGLAAVGAVAWAFDTGGAVLLGESAVVLIALAMAPGVRRQLAEGFLAGVAAGSMAALGWLYVSGTLAPFIASEADLLTSFDRAYGRPFLFALKTSPFPWLTFFVPAVAVVALAILLQRSLAQRFGPWELKLATLTAVSGAMFRRALDRSDFAHIQLASSFAWVAAVMLVSLVVVGRARRVGAGVLVAMVMLLPAPELLPGHRTLPHLISWLGTRSLEDVTGREPMSEAPRLGIRISAGQARELHPLLDRLSSSADCGRPILDFANYGAVLFLADSANATRFPQIWSASSPERQDEVVRDLAREKPLVIWRSGTDMDRLDRIDNLVRHHRIAAAINRSASGIDRAGGFLLVETGGHGAPTAADSPIDGLALGHLPLVWGEAIGATKSLQPWRWDPSRVRAVDPASGRFEVAAAGPVLAAEFPRGVGRPAAVVVDISLEVSTQVGLSWSDEELPDRQFSVSFETVGDGRRHTYWVPLENHPGWAWSQGVRRLFLSFERPPGVVELGPLRGAGLP